MPLVFTSQQSEEERKPTSQTENTREPFDRGDRPHNSYHGSPSQLHNSCNTTRPSEPVEYELGYVSMPEAIEHSNSSKRTAIPTNSDKVTGLNDEAQNEAKCSSNQDTCNHKLRGDAFACAAQKNSIQSSARTPWCQRKGTMWRARRKRDFEEIQEGNVILSHRITPLEPFTRK